MPEETQTSIPQATLDARIEALLFATGSAIPRTTLARVLNSSKEEITDAIENLRTRLANSGTTLVETDNAIALATSPSTTETVASVRKQQFSQDIGEAGLEVLAIVLYKGSATRAVIDYIRGVNSAATIRTLSTRGLIERDGKSGGEGSAYRATTELLAHLGVTHVSDLPEYDDTISTLREFEEKKNAVREPEATQEEE